GRGDPAADPVGDTDADEEENDEEESGHGGNDDVDRTAVETGKQKAGAGKRRREAGSYEQHDMEPQTHSSNGRHDPPTPAPGREVCAAATTPCAGLSARDISA